MTRFIQPAVALLGLATLLACGGGGGGGTPAPPPKTIADTLTYTNPTAGNYRLVRDSTSTQSRLVLDLVGPATGTAHGVAFILTLSGSASWTNPDSYTQNVAFSLGSTPQILSRKLSGNTLQVGIFQKSKATGQNPTPATAVSLNQTLAKVSLDLGTSVPVGTTITISATKGSVMLADGSLIDLSTSPNQISVGSLVAN